MANQRYVTYNVFSDHPKHKRTKVQVFIPEGDDPLVAANKQSHDFRTIPLTYTKGKATLKTRFSYRRVR